MIVNPALNTVGLGKENFSEQNFLFKKSSLYVAKAE